MSPSKYINQLKLDKARFMIVGSDKSITQIAEELGFNSIHYFSRVFKKEFGVPPSIYMDSTRVNLSVNIQNNLYTLREDDEFPLQSMGGSTAEVS